MSAEEEEYVVDRVIAQSELEDESIVYLVRWEGYGEEQCTWEPRESFTSEATIQEWERDQAEGRILPPDEYGKILDSMESFTQEQQQQDAESKRRNLKRKGTSDPPMSSSDLQTHSRPSSPLKATSRAPQREPTNRSTVNDDGSLRKPMNITTVPKRFHGAGIVSKARKSRIPLHPPRQPGTGGPLFKTLRRQNHYQRATRTERAPDPSTIRLFAATESVAEPGGDVAHNLPRGIPRQPAAPANASQSVSNQQMELPPATENGNATDSTRLLESPYPSRTLTGETVYHRPMSTQSTPASAVHTSPHVKADVIRWTQNGRFWRHGEILVTLSYGDSDVIGDVRLCGIPGRFFRSFISLKKDDCIDVTFKIADVIKRPQYEALCRGRSHEVFSNAWFTGYDDTNRRLEKFGQILLDSEAAALWYHPEASYVLVAYAAASKIWKFLSTSSEEELSAGSPVRLVLRSSMPGPESLSQQQSNVVRPHTSDKGANVQATSSQQMAPALLLSPNIPRSKSSAMLQALLMENQTTRYAHDSCTEIADTDEVTHQTLNVPFSISKMGQTEVVSHDQRDQPSVRSSTEAQAAHPQREDSMSIDSSFSTPGESDEAWTIDFTPFEQKYNITYDYLTRSTVKSRSALDTSKTRFFLAFPQAASSEEEILRHYLGSKTMPSLIFTDDEYGWDTFKEFTGSRGDKQGVIIVHASMTDFSSLSGLATQLLKSNNVNVFRMSLGGKGFDSQVSTYCHRLFPKSRSLLVSESTMIQHPGEALSILRWYNEMSKKRYGTWKLFLRPNVKYWLESQAIASTDKKSSYLAMLTLVRDITREQSPAYYICDSDQSEAEAYEGDNEENGKAGILVSPGSLSVYPSTSSTTDVAELEKLDAVLLEHFAAWACLHAHSLRRFTAVSPFSRSEWNKWGHIEILNAREYLQDNKVRVSAGDGTTT